MPTTRRRASIAASAAARTCSAPRPSTTAVRAGRASGCRWPATTCARRPTGRTAWCAPKSPARAAMRTWATCSTTARSRPASATASIRPRSTSSRPRPRTSERRPAGRRTGRACRSRARRAPGGARRGARAGRRPPCHVAAVICHPHPLFGGTLHNKVVHTLARTLRDGGRRDGALQFSRRGCERRHAR